MPLEPIDKSRLILAYGQHWRRSEVRWSHGKDWQMLGRVGTNRWDSAMRFRLRARRLCVGA